MNKRADEKINRSDFLRIAGRAFVLGLLLLIPGFLVSKRRVSAKAKNCDLNLQCKNCGKNTDCDLIKENNGQKR